MKSLVFKQNIFSRIWNAIGMTIGLGILLVAVEYFFKVKLLYIGIAAVVGLFLILLSLTKRFEIRVEGEQLIVLDGRSEKEYRWTDYEIGYYISHGNGNSYTLKLMEPSGRVHEVDCDRLGGTQFEALVEALHVVGDNAPVQRVEVKRKED